MIQRSLCLSFVCASLLAACHTTTTTRPAVVPPPAPAPSEPAAPIASAPAAPIEQRFVATPRIVPRFADPDRDKKIAAALTEIDALVISQMAAQRLPGLAFGVVVDGELRRSWGLGVADVGEKRSVDADTVFRIASITKTFTSMALLELRDAGKLSLDDLAERYLPELASVRYPTRDSPRITIRSLLSHTSGLPRDGRFDGDQSLRDVTEKEVTDCLENLELAFVPGSRYQYSNLGFSLLGLVIKAAAGVSYRDTMQRLVLDPLHLGSAAWDASSVPAAKLATGYRREGDRVVPVSFGRLGASEADGGLFISLRDLARYASFQLDAYPPRDADDGGPLRRSSVREAHSLGRLISFDIDRSPSVDKNASIVEARARAVGLAWHGSATCDFDPVIGHDGAIGGFHSAISLLPQQGIAVLALTNDANADLTPMTRGAINLFAKHKVPAREDAPLPAAALTDSIAPWLAVYESWDETRYLAMLSEGHKSKVKPETEKAELAGYFKSHGHCKDPRFVRTTDTRSGVFSLSCERGRLELWIEVEDGTGKITGFGGESFGVPPGATLSRAAAAVHSQLTHWDAKSFHHQFVDSFQESAQKSWFEGEKHIHGVCKPPVPRSFDFRGDGYFTMSCERGGGLLLRVHVQESHPDQIDWLKVTPLERRTCP